MAATTTTAVNLNDGFVNGSDIIFEIDGKPVGHCTSHKTTYNAETKERAFKPVKSASPDDGKWTKTGVGKLTIEVSFDGLRHYAETEGGFKKLLAAFKSGKPVTCKQYERSKDTAPYLECDFVITQLEETNNAAEDATYSGQMRNADAPKTFNPDNLTGETLTA